jgi:putative ABC transport system permease protein
MFHSHERALMHLFSGFAVLAVLISTFGLFALMLYFVAARTQEIGVRMALGAAPGMVTRMFTREAAAVIAAGLLIGVAASMIFARLLSGFLFRISPGDPLTTGCVRAILIAAGALATWFPARQVLRIDPAVALRVE